VAPLGTQLVKADLMDYSNRVSPSQPVMWLTWILSIFRQKLSLREGAAQSQFEVVALLCVLIASNTLLSFLRFMQPLHGSICTTTATTAETTVTHC
jgi:hypothetical protein